MLNCAQCIVDGRQCGAGEGRLTPVCFVDFLLKRLHQNISKIAEHFQSASFPYPNHMGDQAKRPAAEPPSIIASIIALKPKIVSESPRRDPGREGRPCWSAWAVFLLGVCVGFEGGARVCV